jgi:hypothetical protein
MYPNIAKHPNVAEHPNITVVCVSNWNPIVGGNCGSFEYKSRQPPQTFVCCPPFVMSDSEGEKIEHEIVVVGCQLAFVNHKLQI